MSCGVTVAGFVVGPLLGVMFICVLEDKPEDARSYWRLFRLLLGMFLLSLSVAVCGG